MKLQLVRAAALVLFALLVAGCGDESPEKRLLAAKDHLQKKDSKSAVIEIKNALQKNPELGEARYLLGSILLNEGNPVGAEVELRKALAAKYADAQLVPDLARSMLLQGQAKKVVDEFGSTRIGQPQADANLQTTLAMAYAALDKNEQFKSAMAAALAADATYAPALLLSARYKAGQRDFDGALAVIDGVLARDAADTAAWQLKGDILLYTQKKLDEALAAYRQALQADPAYRPAHVSTYAVLLQQGKLDEAGAQLEQLKRFGANHPQTRFMEAQLAYQKKDYKRARELTQPLVQQASGNPRVLQLAGAVELQVGALAQAEIYLAKALQLAPQLALAQRLLIETYLRSGQSAKALSALNAAAGKDGLPPALYPLAGEVYLQNGDAKKAEEYFAKSLKIDPTDARRRTALALTHLAAGQTDSAIDELQNIAASDPGVTADLALISTHLRRKDYAKALAAVDRLEAKQPDKPVAANLRGRIQLAQKDNPGARKSFERALVIDPNFFAAAASLAAMDMADKKPEDARKRFEALLAKNPKNGQALLSLAQLAAATGTPKEEIATLLNKAIDANPGEAAPRLMLVELHLRNNDQKQALTVAQSGVSALPASAELLTALGGVQQLSGDLNQAIATYNKLVQLQPLSPVPHVRLAEAQLANKDKRAAEQSLAKALELKPDFLDAQRELILLALDGKRYPDALKVARTVQEQRPKTGLGYMLEGDINAARKDWPAAVAAYKAALRVDPAASELAVKLHAATQASGATREAEQFAATWLGAHPKDVAFLWHLASGAIARNDYAGAEKLYQSLLQVQPNAALALNNLAWAQLQLGKDGALGHAEKANTLAPNQPQFMDTLAMVLSARGEHAKAVELQAKALALQPKSDALRLNLARIYIAAGDKTKARAELETVSKAGDKSPYPAEASALLKTL